MHSAPIINECFNFISQTSKLAGTPTVGRPQLNPARVENAKFVHIVNIAAQHVSHDFWGKVSRACSLAAVGGDGRLLFMDDGEATHTYLLEDPLDPLRLDTLPRTFPRHPRWNFEIRNPCVFAAARGDSAVDVFCEDWGYVVEWRAGGHAIAETDRIEGGSSDRFNRLVPEFGEPVGMAASPDGRHVYLSSAEKGILMFERVASPGDGHRLSRPEEPDLVVVSGSVDDPAPFSDGSFRFSATVRNRGNTPSDATTLRVYRSPDAAISSSDTQIATLPVDSLATGEDADASLSMTAPSNAGTYYYGACIDAIDSEANVDNNCAGGVEVRVRTARPELIVQTPTVDDATLVTGESFTLRTTVRNRGEGRSGGTTLRYYRSTDSTVSSGDDEVGTELVGRLDAGGESQESVSLTAPLTAGAYYYGACVDAVDNESDVTNNCSNAVEVTVSENGGVVGGTDDHGNGFASATPVVLSSTTEGELEVGGDRDYFQIAVDLPTSITVETKGGTDTYCTLFNDDQESLATDDDSGTNLNCRIEATEDAGEYVIEVRGYSGSTTGRYELSVGASD